MGGDESCLSIFVEFARRELEMFGGGEFGSQTAMVVATHPSQCIFRDIDTATFDRYRLCIVQKRCRSGIHETGVNRQTLSLNDIGGRGNLDIRAEGGNPAGPDENGSVVHQLSRSCNNPGIFDCERANVKSRGLIGDQMAVGNRQPDKTRGQDVIKAGEAMPQVIFRWPNSYHSGELHSHREG